MAHHDKIWFEKYKGQEVIFIAGMWMIRFIYLTMRIIPFFITLVSNIATLSLLWRRRKTTTSLLRCPYRQHRDFPVSSVFRKKTYTGLLANFFQFRTLFLQTENFDAKP